MSLPDPDAVLEQLHALLKPLAKCEPHPEPLTKKQRKMLASKRKWIEFRESLGLSRRAAARLLGYSPSALDGWESPSDFLRAPPDYVFDLLPELVADQSQTTNEIPRTGT